jgi:hypothetical protein
MAAMRDGPSLPPFGIGDPGAALEESHGHRIGPSVIPAARVISPLGLPSAP